MSAGHIPVVHRQVANGPQLVPNPQEQYAAELEAETDLERKHAATCAAQQVWVLFDNACLAPLLCTPALCKIATNHCHGTGSSACFLQASIQQLEAEIKSASDALQSLECQVCICRTQQTL